VFSTQPVSDEPGHNIDGFFSVVILL